jgi:hypothetical protein
LRREQFTVFVGGKRKWKKGKWQRNRISGAETGELMGNEAKCAARIDGKRHEGKALLETSELIFRGAECRVKVTFGEIRGVTAADGELRVKTKDGVTVFEIGPVAEKWREKILHPKTRAENWGSRRD